MAYSELIKNFERIRDYMREFYVYGFKSRDDYDKKSARSYDDERRRIESWLGEYMRFRHTQDGKNVFISIDSRVSRHNPLYKAWKACSFTDGDITLHFILFDILHSPDITMSVSEITDIIDNAYLSCFPGARLFDESTVRKKLKEYVSEGLLLTEKQGKNVLYRRAPDTELPCADILDFFSETAPCGVIGSFLLDKAVMHDEHFTFKHHYITHALDSDILLSIFSAMREKREITIAKLGLRDEEPVSIRTIPLRIFVSSQNGRQYLMAYHPDHHRVDSFRLDYILKVDIGNVCDKFDQFRKKLDRMQNYMWGVSCRKDENKTEHVEFTLRFDDGEEYIYHRLEREKRCGRVELVDAHTCRFTADVYDTKEMIPWIRTFICRITQMNLTNKKVESQFKNDLDVMYCLYGLSGGDAQ